MCGRKKYVKVHLQGGGNLISSADTQKTNLVNGQKSVTAKRRMD
jgi:hypothetical protein